MQIIDAMWLYFDFMGFICKIVKFSRGERKKKVSPFHFLKMQKIQAKTENICYTDKVSTSVWKCNLECIFWHDYNITNAIYFSATTKHEGRWKKQFQ